MKEKVKEDMRSWGIDSSGCNPKEYNGEDVVVSILHYILEQYELQQRLSIFGKKGEEATNKELKQIDDIEALIHLDAHSLADEEKTKAMVSLMFLTERQDGSIKVRQSNENNKNAYKKMCEGAIVNLLEAFLHAENDEDVVMYIQGRLAELLVMLAPQAYSKYIAIQKGQKVLYVKMHKALYGMLKSALLFYRKLWDDLVGMGFAINPYDSWVANKMINWCQMTITWHVDDLKILHKNGWEIMKIIKQLGVMYGNIKVKRRKVYKYLGMNLDTQTHRWSKGQWSHT